METPDRSPRRILMTTDTVGGVWTFSIELCRCLPGVEILLAAMGGRANTTQRDQVRQLPNVQLIDSDYLLEWMQDPWEDVRRAGEWLQALAGRFQPDLIHLNGYVHATLPWNVPVLVTAHSCVPSWWRAVRKTAVPPEWDTYRRKVRVGLLAADLITAPTAAMARDLRQLHDVSGSISVIPNGVSLGMDGTPLHEKQNFYLTAGRLWDEAKNVSALAEIAPDLPWPLVMAGDAGVSNKLRRPNVRLKGQLSPAEMRRHFQEAAVYVHPARYEPFGLAVLEAAQCGCALVLGDIDSLREIWRDAAVWIRTITSLSATRF